MLPPSVTTTDSSASRVTASAYTQPSASGHQLATASNHALKPVRVAWMRMAPGTGSTSTSPTS